MRFLQILRMWTIIIIVTILSLSFFVSAIILRSSLCQLHALYDNDNGNENKNKFIAKIEQQLLWTHPP